MVNYKKIKNSIFYFWRIKSGRFKNSDRKGQIRSNNLAFIEHLRHQGNSPEKSQY